MIIYQSSFDEYSPNYGYKEVYNITKGFLRKEKKNLSW